MDRSCKQCGIVKDISEFHFVNRKKYPNCRRTECKCCAHYNAHVRLQQQSKQAKQYKHNYYICNKERLQKITKQRYLNNPAKALARKQRKHLWYLKNRQKTAESARIARLRRRHTDSAYKLQCNLKRRLLHALRGNFKNGSAVRDLGCTIEEYRGYLTSKFQFGWNWENHGKVWHIDHIIPLSKFDLTDREQFLKACHYTNTQPLSVEENLRKGNR